VSILTVTINDPSLAKRSSEVAYIVQALEIVAKEIGRGNGNTTSGSIIGVNSAGASNASLGSWTYSSSAGAP
jgi:hypothetical protein